MLNTPKLHIRRHQKILWLITTTVINFVSQFSKHGYRWKIKIAYTANIKTIHKNIQFYRQDKKKTTHHKCIWQNNNKTDSCICVYICTIKPCEITVSQEGLKPDQQQIYFEKKKKATLKKYKVRYKKGNWKWPASFWGDRRQWLGT